MNLQINFSKEFKEYKFSDSVIWVFGTLFNNNIQLSKNTLAEFLVKNIQSKNITKQNLNGFFSFCYVDDEYVIIGTDHLRTKVIFYKLDENTISISDSAENLLIENKKKNVDITALNEFKATGYILGNRTLFQEIKYIQGGTLFYINRKNKQTHSETFFSFNHNRKNYSWEQLKDKYDEVIDNIFDRFIEYADGRQIVVPLSAGYDSLLIVAVLKRKGYDNVLTFTYGKKGNEEALISKKVAQSLGLKWEFVEYTKEKWLREWKEESIKDFISYTMNLHCLPHIQDYIAVKEMKERGVLEKDAIFAPGHCPTGVRFPKFIFYQEASTKKELVDFILDYHFVNDRNIINKNKKIFRKYVSQFCECNNFNSHQVLFADIIELWQWHEREPKYIVNSIRNYTFFGFDYWMPLWDMEHAIFWRDMSFKIAGDRRWFEWYIENTYNRLIGKEENLEFYPLKEYPKEYILKHTFIRDFITRLLIYIKTKEHPLLFEAIYSKKEYFKEIVVKGNHLLSGYANKFLKIILK